MTRPQFRRRSDLAKYQLHVELASKEKPEYARRKW
jgi:hypothetical protein